MNTLSNRIDRSRMPCWPDMRFTAAGLQKNGVSILPPKTPAVST